MQLTTPPLAPSVLNTLKKLGIHTHEQLRSQGAVTTFLLLKASGLTITDSVLWQLEMLSRYPDSSHLTPSEKAKIKASIKKHPPVAIFPPVQEMSTYMQAALEQAEQAAQLGEVPVGAVIVYQNNIIATAHNRCIHDHNISHHAEIQVLAQAGKALNNYRLEQCDLYVTLEPCAMCASAILQARIHRLIYAAHEPKTGAAGSVLNLFTNPQLNQHTAVLSGIKADTARHQLQTFFRQRRSNTPPKSSPQY